MLLLAAVIICSMLYAIKGGQHGRIPLVARLRKNPYFYRALDGKVLSAVGFGLLVAFHGAEYQGFIGGGPAYALASLTGLLATLAWLAGSAPRVGRVIGNIGGYRGNWDAGQNLYPMPERKIFAAEGWKAGVQRGVFMGALLALATDNLWFIVAGATYPLTVYAGVSIGQLKTGKFSADWIWHEFLFGAVIGLAFLAM